MLLYHLCKSMCCLVLICKCNTQLIDLKTPEGRDEGGRKVVENQPSFDFLP